MFLGKILVIRGGAIGDFVLTLPALGLLRNHFPEAQIELLAYPHIASIVDQRYYVDKVRSIEYGPLSGFFNPHSELNPELQSYFAGFSQVISYLYDPDGFFEFNLRRCGVQNLIQGNPLITITDSEHASRQLAKPLEKMALYLEDPFIRLHPSKEDRIAARKQLQGCSEKVLAIHTGSGSERKNWPVKEWKTLVSWLLESSKDLTIALVFGESDGVAMKEMQHFFAGQERIRNYHELPLPTLVALFEQCIGFIGHDSGISHLAAAAGCPSLILFGPTSPKVWAPLGNQVAILSSPSHQIIDLEQARVQQAILTTLGRNFAV